MPLRELLPSLSSHASISSAVLPTFPTVAVISPNPLGESSTVAPDAADEPTPPTISIPIEYPSYKLPSGPAAVPSLSSPSSGGLSNESETQMKGRKPKIAAAGTFFTLFSFSQIYQNVIFPRVTPPTERAEESRWVASSHSWLDRRICNWFGLCGLTHLNRAHWTTKNGNDKPHVLGADDKEQEKIDLKEFWHSAQALPEDWTEKELADREIPKYVIEHAPLIHLYSGEEYWPCDMADHLFHTTPHLNYTPLQATNDHPTLENLDDLNKWGRFVYLQSDDNVEDRPEWLGGESNIPDVPEGSDPDDLDWSDDNRPHGHYEEDEDGENSSWWDVGIGDTKDRGGIRPTASAASDNPRPTKTPQGDELVDTKMWQSELIRRQIRNKGQRVIGGRSDAPAVLIVVPKDNGVVDAFWFFFYSYNLGNAVFNVRFGNHVGDWEHTTVRFQDGVPKAVFFSEHSFGEAYTWDAVEKSGKRVSLYSSTCVQKLTLASPSDSPQPERTRCTQPLGSILTFSPGASSTTLQIAALCGTQP